MIKNVYVGMDIGGTKISSALIDSAGKILAQNKVPTIQKAKPAEIYKQVKGLIKDLLSQDAAKETNLIGIGIGVPGVIGPDRKSIYITPNINLARYALAANLQKLYKVVSR